MAVPDMTPDTYLLHTGENLQVDIIEPPLSESCRNIIWWRLVQDELLEGAWSDTLYTAYFVGKIDHQFVGSLACYTPADTRDIGVVGFVSTEDHHRRKGIASVLMDCMINHFINHGGKALYLCTNNPSAGILYEKHGFEYHVGDGMRYLAPGAENFDLTYFGSGCAATVRPATWGDLPRFAALYNHAEPDWLIKNYLTQSFNETRVEIHFIQLMKRIENGNGAIKVLETSDKRLIGAAAFERLGTYYEQHVAHLTFRICPGYFAQAQDLLSACESDAEQMGIDQLQVHAADRDVSQIELLKSQSYVEVARYQQQLKDGQTAYDLLVFGKNLAGGRALIREKEAYYGGRKSWQTDRLLDIGPN